uniref:G-protein coupled receptors family 1 profile domain-containing protein n=1 Tax=Panagrolaimus sp. ES5 TaxID=591445 RepID=A0AC34G9P2_9BILA
MLTYALVSNILIVYGILKSNTMRSATSYWFIISLAVCDIIMIIISLVHLVPATAFHNDFVQYMSIRNIVMIFFYDLFWYTAVLQLDYYITVYDPPDTWYKYVDVAINSLSLVMMIFSYAVIIYKVRESGKAMAKYQLTIRTRVGSQKLLFQQQAQQMNGSEGCSRASSLRPPRSQVSKKEMRLFIQFFVVSVVFLLTWTTWQWLPYIYHSKWAYFVMTSLFFINNSVNPTVYLLFNTQLRRELHYLLCRKHAIAAAHNRRKRTILNRHANAANRQEVTEFHNGVVPSSTVSNANEVSQSSNSSSTEYTFLKDPRKFLIHNGGIISSTKKKKLKTKVSSNGSNNTCCENVVITLQHETVAAQTSSDLKGFSVL